MLTIDTPSITTYLLTRSTVDGYKLILTSLLVLMGISNRSPAKNLSVFAGYLADWQCNHYIFAKYSSTCGGNFKPVVSSTQPFVKVYLENMIL